MPNSPKELGYYRIDPNEAKAKAGRTTSEEFIRRLLEALGTNNPESTFSPAADFSLQEPANSIIAKIVNKVINSRNEVYHATYPERATSILVDKAVEPRSTTGVSVSRIPGINTFGSPVNLVFDAAKMPPTTPIAEPGFRKGPLAFHAMNPNFEFENRTQGPLPLDALKKILVRKSLLTGSFPNQDAQALQELSKVPIETFDSLKELRTNRARRAWDDYIKTKQQGQLGVMDVLQRLLGVPQD